MKRFLLFLCLCGALLTLACGKKETPLTLLTESYPPLTYAIGDSITGYGADVVRAIQLELGTSFTSKLITWDKAYRRALTEPNIVLYTMERTPERDSLFYWVGPLGENVTRFYVRTDSKIEIKALEDAKKLKAVATTTDWFSEEYLVRNGFDNLVSSEKPGDTVKQIISGRAQAGIYTDTTFKKIVQDAGFLSTDLSPSLEVMRTKYYIAISKQTDPKIAQEWQTAFEKISKSGLLKQIRGKWFPE